MPSTLRDQLDAELQRLQGCTGSPAATARVSNGTGTELSVDFLAVDTIGCEVEQVAVRSSALAGAAFAVLQRWAEQLSRKITYLLEQVAPLEFDEPAGQVLLRSTRPDQLPDGARYYELLLQSHGQGGLVLRRYHATKGQPGRQPVSMSMTREVLLKLADDLMQTMPGGGP